jgi:hypothetical protein
MPASCVHPSRLPLRPSASQTQVAIQKQPQRLNHRITTPRPLGLLQPAAAFPQPARWRPQCGKAATSLAGHLRDVAGVAHLHNTPPHFSNSNPSPNPHPSLPQPALHLSAFDVRRSKFNVQRSTFNVHPPSLSLHLSMIPQCLCVPQAHHNFHPKTSPVFPHNLAPPMLGK